ncbi:MAG: hypothetical protein IT539_06080 [Bradyrhizobiaceae bacterium]|nr:hypothetical protein [Bradyrhizobiaceae bacterium]
MVSQPYVVAMLFFAIINGIFSPFLFALFPFVLALTPALFVDSVGFVFYLSSLIFATMTLIVGGIPAALYERWTGATESTGFSKWLWLAGVGLLTLPAAANFFRFGL